MSTIRWGIAGPGQAAEALAEDFRHTTGGELVAVGSRSLSRAREFAGRHGIANVHGSYSSLMSDPDVDLVYIATPTAQHRMLALAAIEAGKGILVEKSFTATLAGAHEVVDAARARKVFAMEGMWTRYQPIIRRLRDLINEGTLGDVVNVQGDLCAGRVFKADDRLFDPVLGGGAMLDLGVYVLAFTRDVIDAMPTTIAVRGNRYPNGVESDFGMLLGYGDGRCAALNCSLRFEGPGRMVVIGTRGWAEVLPRFHHPTTMVLHVNGAIPRTYELPPTGRGYSHEIQAVNDALHAGLLEQPLMPLQHTLDVQTIMAEGFKQLGVTPVDDDTQPA
ncbi:MAG TPA: Gfo/Idh/MocA family oxidoreductase [Propionibacteriaceae bacterium]|nr:Gfo/Idh/MocA family oxidoreductase [Propionibacteriaceae bacterium]